MRARRELPGRDIVVVGASAGGVEALRTLVAGLPEDFPASMFVVLHVPPTTSVLPAILTRGGRLPAAHAVDGDPIQHGRIYVAPPDYHLLLEEGVVRLERGPRENGHRPAIDPLFRTAAIRHGERVAGVILSGSLDDGIAGLATIKRLGGAVIVQDPADALYPTMPKGAVAAGIAEEVLPAAGIPSRLVELATTKIGAESAKFATVENDPTQLDPATITKALPRFTKRGGKLVLVSDDRRVLRTLEITGLDRKFMLEPRLSDAIAHVVEEASVPSTDGRGK